MPPSCQWSPKSAVLTSSYPISLLLSASPRRAIYAFASSSSSNSSSSSSGEPSTADGSSPSSSESSCSRLLYSSSLSLAATSSH